MKRLNLVITSVLIPLLAGCTGTAGGGAAAPQTPGSSSESAASVEQGLPGYVIGEFPPVPLFVMPDLSMLDSSLSGFSIKVRDSFPTVPGVTIRPATCDKSGSVQADAGTLQFYGDGSGTYSGADGTIHNYGDGSGSFSLNGKTVHVYGDGSGDYSDGKTTIHAYGDGSGDYSDGKITIHLYGDGSGDYSDGNMTIHNYGSGSGDYSDGNTTIHNYGDGTGDYIDSAGSRRISVSPIAPVATLGRFPSMGTLKPIKSCGTRITIEDSLMFDFNKDTLRPEAKTTIASLAKVFNDLKVSRASISGHTDSVGSDSYNQGLSERRANAVVKALKDSNVTTAMDAKGYGETKPVAPNEIKGKDNPAGRQLNRRVEIFIPANS